jgi:hypothetical protein
MKINKALALVTITIAISVQLVERSAPSLVCKVAY